MRRLSAFLLIIPLLAASALPAASQSPTTTEELLSGMVTEEVEPGVFRVVNDGVRDLASVEAVDVVAGYDDGIWLLLQDDEFLRLGSGESHLWAADTDGTAWLPFDEQRLWIRLFLTEAGDLYGVWCYGDCFLIPYEDGNDLARFAEGITDEEWAPLTSADLPDIRYGLGLDHPFEVTPDDSLWASLWRSPDGGDPRDGDASVAENLLSAVADGRLVCDGLARFDGKTLDRFLRGQCISMDVAADGSVWVLADEQEGKVLYVITPEAVK